MKYLIELPNTKRTKQDWIKFIRWWEESRQSFDIMPLKLRKFKKRYNTTMRMSAKRLYKWKQRKNENPKFVKGAAKNSF